MNRKPTPKPGPKIRREGQLRLDAYLPIATMQLLEQAALKARTTKTQVVIDLINKSARPLVS